MSQITGPPLPEKSLDELTVTTPVWLFFKAVFSNGKTPSLYTLEEREARCGAGLAPDIIGKSLDLLLNPLPQSVDIEILKSTTELIEWAFQLKRGNCITQDCARNPTATSAVSRLLEKADQLEARDADDDMEISTAEPVIKL
ncbi:hypothetical protein SARC_06462 [Sphaeroforma arctica JP610]|uniref:Uncharacterized protein n=1 Tax=Sphaeroforma arctica JP610 TaxID=667725 RepID=A0A0L0FXC3_9EUKA|nr:hypothetical protein SARC_06462 [Sphaeroforma arctica JP610]KNC81201.1 hypothetical protein SARC_06462 [Sphaeroforma arctica JP610]|eukprot:XP_014155103.1 hypothetical protein SARC_06462 [Sphaeroforma arctica JP610]